MSLPPVKVEVESLKKTGVNKAGRNYFIMSAYAMLPGIRHPQLIEFYTESQMSPGLTLQVPIVVSVRDGKPSFDLDYQAATAVKVGA